MLRIRCRTAVARNEELAASLVAGRDDLVGTVDLIPLPGEDGIALQQKLEQTLDDLSRAARSLRALSDTLEQQPRSLLTGRPQELP